VRDGEGVPDPRKHKPGDAAFERLFKCELAAFEGHDHIAGVKLDAIGLGNGIHASGIEAQGVESGEGVARRRGRRRGSTDRKRREKTDGQAEPHRTSVVTFSMQGQGERRSSFGGGLE